MLDRRGTRKYLNWPEREAFVHAVQADADRTRRLFCLTLFYTGCRISEALALTPAHIDPEEVALVFETLKQRRTGAFRAVPIPEQLLRGLQELPSVDPEKPLWPFSRTTAYRLIRERMQQAKIKGVRACARGLRHSYGMAMVSRGVPVPLVQRWLGHARMETTAIYLDLLGEEERQQAEKLWKTCPGDTGRQ